MSTIRIGMAERTLSEVGPSWVTQQVNRRRDDGQPVCVQVQISEPGVSVSLVSGECGAGGARGVRAPNPTEREVLELWRKLGLEGDDFADGKVVAFLKQLGHVLG